MTTPMRFFKFSVAFAVAMSAITANAASQGLEDFKKCTELADNEERLACFDAAAKALQVPKPGATLQNTHSLQAETERLRIETRRLKKEAQQLRAEKKVLEEVAETAQKEVTSLVETVERVKQGLAFNPEGIVTKILKLRNKRVRIFLDNKHVWDQIASGRITALKVGAKVVVSRSTMGAYTLKVDGMRGILRVEKLR